MQINNLKLIPNWRITDLQGERLHESFLPLLQSITQFNKLTKAAKQCDLSYRHAWNILQEAEAFFGAPVTTMKRGRGANLTELGKVLLQANQRIEARLHTQMESLDMELNAEVHRVLSDQIGVILIHASHGYAVALIPEHLTQYQVELHYHGPEDALRALNAGACKIAGFNLPSQLHISQSEHHYRELLDDASIKVLQFIERQQGLMLRAENSAGVASIADLTNHRLRFINRQPRSGTRKLFDQLLIDANIETHSIQGYENHEYTHSAIAAHVATGMADVGFGVEAAARRFDLDFVPVTQDRYYWAYRAESEHEPEIAAFRQTLLSTGYQQAVNALPGYKCNHCGELTTASALFS